MADTQPAPDRLLSGRVARGALVTGARAMAGFGVSAATMLVLTHRLHPSAFGVYTVLVAASQIAYQMITAGFAYAFSRGDAIVDDAVISAAFWTFEAVYAAVAVLLVALSFALTSPYAHIILRGMSGFLLIAPLRFPMMVRCWRRLEMGRLAMIDFSEFAVLQLGSLALILAGVGPAAFAYAIVAAVCTSSGLSLSLMRWRPPRPVFGPLRPWLRETRPLVAVTSLMLLRDYGAGPVLSIVFGTAVAGYYGWAAGVSAAAVALAWVLSYTLYLGFAQATDRAVIPDALRRATRLLALFAGFIVAVVAGAARPMTVTIFTARWLPALLGLRLLLGALALIIIMGVFINLAISERRTRTANRWLMLLLALMVGLGLPAAAAWGMPGYAGALLFSTALVTVIAWRTTSSLYKIGSEVAHAALAAAASALITVIAASWMFASDTASWLVLAEAVAFSIAAFAAGALILTRGGALRDVQDAFAMLRS